MGWDDDYYDDNYEVDYCYESQCPCENRCGYSHCADDDIQMIADFIESGELAEKLCYNEKAIFATGNSNGGIFTWYLAQEEKTAKLFAGIAPTIAAPVCGYNKKAETSVPVISLVGRNDPTHPVFTRNPYLPCKESTRYEGGYRFVTSHKITTTFAKGAPGCEVTDENELPPKKSYRFKGIWQLKCRTWCTGKTPFSLDCHYDGKHDDMPKDKAFAYEAAMKFFDSHLEARAEDE